MLTLHGMKIMWMVVVGVSCALAACGGDDGGGTAAMATSPLTGLAGATVTGTGTFVQGAPDTAADSVTLTLTINGCVDTKVYGAHIHQGSACTDNTTQGGHWDTTRGEGIPSITCSGTTGTTTINRAATDATIAWSVGGAAATDVIGHVIVVHDPDTATTRIACGVIAAAP